MKTVFTYFLLLLAFSSGAQTMQFGLFNSKNVNAFTVSIRSGKYLLVCDGEKYGEYKKNNIFFVSRQGNKIEIRDKKNTIGIFKEVKLSHLTSDAIFTLKGVNPTTVSHEYEESINFNVLNNKLQAKNYIDLEKYIAGVIEAEGGIDAPLEYYKAQAVLIRTYTIKNIYKHAEEGFNLCDEVHCQAYHGRSVRNEEIYTATKATAGLVLMDTDSVLVMSPFHSSCGGETCSAGIYWQSDLPYLKSVKDPFCVGMRNYNWEKEIPIMDWFAFLKTKGISDPNNYTNYKSMHRQKYYINNPHQVTFRQIREKFGLRSSFFSISRKGSKIVFSGHGYGHGIGMCQIGAMEMAKVGFTYIDIVHFYFQDIYITDYREMELHRY